MDWLSERIASGERLNDMEREVLMQQQPSRFTNYMCDQFDKDFNVIFKLVIGIDLLIAFGAGIVWMLWPK